MILFFAGHTGGVPEDMARILPFMPAHMASVWYAQVFEEEKPWRPAGTRYMIDSGAFSALSSARRWGIAEFLAGRARVLAALGGEPAEWLTLDVIGDQKATWENYERLTNSGVQTIPIVTMGSGLADIERGIAAGRVAFGGLVGKPRAARDAWLRMAFAPCVAAWRRTGVMPKVHLLGVGDERTLSSFPAYSADSSSWTGPARWGRQREIGAIPPRAMARAVGDLAMRREIEHGCRLASRVTARWEARGLRWD